MYFLCFVICVSVKTPDDVVTRYMRVLSEVQKGHSKRVAYQRQKVDRNTIASQAPIAELAVANPTLFQSLKGTFKHKDSLKTFAETCLGFCLQEPTASTIILKKKNGALLDIFKK